MATINVFIHGIGSSGDTWKELLNFIEVDISDGYDKKFTEYSFKKPINKGEIYFYNHTYRSKITITKISIIEFFTDSFQGQKSYKEISIDDYCDTFYAKLQRLMEYFDNINIFAHSLGGVITIKSILKNLNDKTSLNKINKITYIAVPFLGSKDPAALYTFMSTTRVKYIMQTTRVLDQLKDNSPFINNLAESIIANKQSLLDINSYYIYGINDGRIVDPRKFAESNIVATDIISVAKDHKTIIKIDDTDNMVADYITRVIHEAEEIPLDNTSMPAEQEKTYSFDDYFEPCPPERIESSYCDELKLPDDIIKKQYDSKPVQAFEKLFKMCFSIDMPDATGHIKKDDPIFLPQGDDLEFYSYENIHNLFLNDFYQYPDMNYRDYLNDSLISKESNEVYEHFKTNILRNKILFLSGNIGEGKTTFLKRLYIDLQNDDDLLESKFIPIYYSIKDDDTSEKLSSKLLPKIIEELKQVQTDITVSEKEKQNFVSSAGRIKVKKILPEAKNTISLNDYMALILGSSRHKHADIKKLFSKLKDKDINIVLLLDNLDSFSYTDERYMFMEGDGYDSFKFGVKGVKTIVDEVSKYSLDKLSIIFAIRPYVLTHLTALGRPNHPRFNTHIGDSSIYYIKNNHPKYANEIIRNRITLLNYLLQKIVDDNSPVSKENKELMKTIAGDYKKLFDSLDNVFEGYEKIGNSSMINKFYNIATEGYRTIIKFYNALPFSPSMLEKYMNHGDILLLYKLGLKKKYSQILPRKVYGLNGVRPCNKEIAKGKSDKLFNYPNIFLIVANNECNRKYKNACKANVVTYWLKYLILIYLKEIKNGETVTFEALLDNFSDKNKNKVYEENLVKLTVGSLGTVNEYNCLAYDFYDVNIDSLDDLMLNTKVSLTHRGSALIDHNELFDIGNLQFYVEDWLLPKPKLDLLLNIREPDCQKLKKYVERFSLCSVSYGYIVNTEEYSKVLRPFILDKARLSIWFLTMLEFSYKHEKHLYKDVFENLNLSIDLDKNFFLEKKEKIIISVLDHILKSQYRDAKNKKKVDEKILNSFLELCNSDTVRNSIDDYFGTVYEHKIPIVCMK